MIQFGIEYKKTCGYLQKHNINSIEEIVGKSVYHVFARQGVVKQNIKSIGFNSNKKEWYFVTETSHKLVEIGKEVFFDIDEAKEYEMQELCRRTAEQQRIIVEKKIAERNKDLDTLNSLLKRYPPGNTRCKFVKKCENCSYFFGGTDEDKAVCEGNEKKICYLWSPDIKQFQEWEEEHKAE